MSLIASVWCQELTWQGPGKSVTVTNVQPKEASPSLKSKAWYTSTVIYPAPCRTSLTSTGYPSGQESTPRSLSSHSKHLPLSDLPICLSYFSSARRHDSSVPATVVCSMTQGPKPSLAAVLSATPLHQFGTRCRLNWLLILTLCFYLLLNVTSKLTFIDYHSNPSHVAVFPRLQFVFITDIWRVNSCVIIIIIIMPCDTCWTTCMEPSTWVRHWLLVTSHLQEISHDLLI